MVLFIMIVLYEFDSSYTYTYTYEYDADCDGIVGSDDCNDNLADDADCDGIVTSEDCDDNDSDLGSIENDADCDGIVTSEDCDDNDSDLGSIENDTDCDGVWDICENAIACSGDIFVEGQADLDNLYQCNSYDGDIEIKELDWLTRIRFALFNQCKGKSS